MKILIVSQHIFPIQTPRSLRATELVKAFSKKGYQVTVYSVLGNFDYSEFQLEYNVSIKNIEIKWEIVPYTSDGVPQRNLIDKVLGKLFGKIFEFPYMEFYYKVLPIIRKEPKFDVIITIGNPHHIHWGAARAKIMLKDKFPVKWIADCGDPFMNNGKSKAHLSYYSKFERRFCEQVDYVTVPHEGAKEGYYEEFRHKIKVIPQGFDFELDNKNVEPQNKVTTFAYTGVFLSDIRNPKLLMDYLLELKHIQFKFVIYTPYTDLIDKYRDLLKEKIEIRKPIPRDQLLKELSKMDFLLNLENVDTPTAIPSKLIDYSISQRPILSINPNNIDKVKILEFLAKDYTKQYKVENINQYHVDSVIRKFEELF